MAYYDAYTAQAAQTALGRSLAAFDTQDADPTVNGSADANLLASLIKTTSIPFGPPCSRPTPARSSSCCGRTT